MPNVFLRLCAKGDNLYIITPSLVSRKYLKGKERQHAGQLWGKSDSGHGLRKCTKKRERLILRPESKNRKEVILK